MVARMTICIVATVTLACSGGEQTTTDVGADESGSAADFYTADVGAESEEQFSAEVTGDLAADQESEAQPYLLEANYEIEHLLDLTGALPGEAGQLLNLVVDTYYNPQSILLDLIVASLVQQVGEPVPDEFWSPLEDSLSDVINDWLLMNTPDCIQDLFVVGQDVVQIASQVELRSLTMVSPGQDLYFCQGAHYWQQVILTWKAGCDPLAPGYAECGKYVFTVEDLLAAAIPISLEPTEFTCMVANIDDFIVDTHSWNVTPGLLVLLAVNEILLPAACGENDLVAWLHQMLDCQAVANAVWTETLEPLGLSVPQVESACLEAVESLVFPVQETVELLSAEGGLKIHGKCGLVGTDPNLGADTLADGLWFGHASVNGTQGGDLEGQFTGQKEL